jgi:predicted transcriptional regulator
MNSMIKNGTFTSISDVVNTSTIFFLGELSIEKTNPNFDYSIIIKNSTDDNSARAKISVALNGYVDDELENLAKSTQKSKSFIVRMALFRFFDVYSKIKKINEPAVIPDEKLIVSKNELEEIVHEMINKILNDK